MPQHVTIEAGVLRALEARLAKAERRGEHQRREIARLHTKVERLTEAYRSYRNALHVKLDMIDAPEGTPNSAGEDEWSRLALLGQKVERLTRERDGATARAERADNERDEARAECAAFAGALEEWGLWPDLPGVVYSAELVDAETGKVRALVLHPDQIKGLSQAIRRHGLTMLPFGHRAVRALYAHDALERERDEAQQALHEETAENCLEESLCPGNSNDPDEWCRPCRYSWAIREAGKMRLRAESAESRVEEMRARKDAAYEERNRVVAVLARMALALGMKAGRTRTAIPGWHEEWHGCVYIELPCGQASWHFHNSHAHLFDDLPEYAATWDGHTTEEKYTRLDGYRPEPVAPSAPALLRLWKAADAYRRAEEAEPIGNPDRTPNLVEQWNSWASDIDQKADELDAALRELERA